MEGSFARSANLHHFKRARWRRLWRQQIQDHLIAAVQNIAILAGAVSSGVAARLPRRPRHGHRRFCAWIPGPTPLRRLALRTVGRRNRRLPRGVT